MASMEELSVAYCGTYILLFFKKVVFLLRDIPVSLCDEGIALSSLQREPVEKISLILLILQDSMVCT